MYLKMKPYYHIRVKNNPQAAILLLVSAVLYLLSLSGCGYTLQGSSSFPFDTVRVGKIVNTTSEPKLQDKLHVALAEEFLRHGIQVTQSSENVLEGRITRFKLRTLSEKREFAAEYEAIIEGDFSFTEESGKIREMKKVSSPFIESFFGADEVSGIVASKEEAAEKALRNLAMVIVSELIYTSP